MNASPGIARPGGRRFGVPPAVPLDADHDAIAELAVLHGCIHAVPDDEVAAAPTLLEAALEHPLMLRARGGVPRAPSPRDADHRGRDGKVLEGVLDLAFEEDTGWTVVDFNAEAEVAGLVTRYRRQVGAYTSMLSRVTGHPMTAVLLRL